MKDLKVTNCVKTQEMVVMLNVSCISPNANQPRKSFEDAPLFALADSIHRHGILQPLSVRQTEPGKYELVAGERRLRAASLLKMQKVPCIIIEADEKTSAVMAIVENIQRRELNYFEEADAIKTLKELYAMTQEQIAQTLSVSQSYVANKLRLLKLNEKQKEMICQNSLTERHCRAIIRIENEEKREEAIKHIIKYALNVTSSEIYIEKLLEDKRTAIAKKPKKLKDIRIFYNSIDKAVESVRNLGIDVESKKNEKGDFTEIVLIIPKNKI
ncbi:MAG: ParB/RepB/Spo0J family partition protein [Clostridia bacterium]|nr:ParB/RepB/Spo0J family partition protein [Clostridia bacterium]